MQQCMQLINTNHPFDLIPIFLQLGHRYRVEAAKWLEIRMVEDVPELWRIKIDENLKIIPFVRLHIDVREHVLFENPLVLRGSLLRWIVPLSKSFLW